LIINLEYVECKRIENMRLYYRNIQELKGFKIKEIKDSIKSL